MRSHPNPLLYAMYGLIKPLVHRYRRFRHPELPDDRCYRNATWDGYTHSFLTRRWDPSDRQAIEQCFKEKQYELGTAMGDGPYRQLVDAAYQKIVRSGKRPLIVDCGANIGASAVWFVRRYPQARVLAIEPDPANFELLAHNCRGLDIQVIAGGVSARDGCAAIANPGGSGMGTYLEAGGDGLVRLYSLTTLLQEHAQPEDVPFLLKIDIEGGEESLCAGNEAALQRFPLIFLEPHDWRFPGQGKTRDFLRFQTESGRDLALHHENLLSLSMELLNQDPARL